MKSPITWILLAGLGFLIWFSFRLASSRIYQVDECTEVFVARAIAAGGQERASLGNISVFQVVLAGLGRGTTRAVELLVSARFVMVELFWLNILLMALATGEKIASRRGLVALLGAATLAPVWDYGFEIRHDNVLLTGMLLTWAALRVRPAGWQSYFIAGALVVALQFAAFKAFVYTIPLSFAALVFPPPGHRWPRWKLVFVWIGGFVAMLLLIRLVYGALGLWDAFLNGFRWTSGVSTSSSYRFAPWPVLGRLLGQTPLLLGLTAAALIAIVVELRRGKAALRWEGNLPEALLLGVAFGALLINPTPFPYNLMHFVPYAFIFAFRHAAAMVKQIEGQSLALCSLVCVAIFTHVVPFAVATRRHLDWPNARQEALIRHAEELTDPQRDPVFDGIGMVATRPIVEPRAFIHSLHIQNLLTGPGARIWEMLKANPAAVIIPNYRTDALTPEDHAYFRDHYVSLADDFLVLGKVLQAGGGDFEVIHAGRYRISTLEGSDLAGTYDAGWKGLLTPEDEGILTGTLDGKPLSKSPVELSVGSHRIECTSNSQPAIVWMGPKLDRIHRIGPGDHRVLFYNWY